MLVKGLFGFFFLTTSLKPAEFAGEGCLSNNYYGTYGDTSLFLLSPGSECFESLSLAAPPSPVTKANHRLMYIHKMPVQDDKVSVNELTDALDRLNAYTPDSDSGTSDSQTTFGLGSQDKCSLLHHTGVDAIISVPPHLIPHIDKALPRSFRAYAIPAEPLSITPVPEEAVDRVKRWLKDLKFNEEIASIASDISVPQMRNDIRYLTGEDLGSPILSRHSFSEGARISANWLRDRIENTGAHCELQQFLAGFAPNLIWYVFHHREVVPAEANNLYSKYKSLDENAGKIIMSAHYDSRGSFGSLRHPGADDDGANQLLTHACQLTEIHLCCRVRHDCNPRYCSHNCSQEDSIQITRGACAFRTSPHLRCIRPSSFIPNRLAKNKAFGAPTITLVSSPASEGLRTN